ncbi:hypothetical protein OAE48_02695 [Flavobacteriales bacterium]|nr:hypothetical protein [Flavobacteriales bacterium]
MLFLNVLELTVTKVKIDNEISMVMMSFGPGGDPESSFKKLNPLRWWKQI